MEIKTRLLKNLLEEVTKKYDYLISQKEEKIEETYQMSITDPLTGLYNRLYVIERLDQELERSIREGTVFSVVMFDLDNFKMINDKYGHLKGDEILRSVGEILKNSFRKYDIVARMGGDEFLAIVFNEKSEIEQRLQNIRKTIEKLFPEENLSVSYGVITIPNDLKDDLSSYAEYIDLLRKELISRVDTAMYENKRKRKQAR